MATDTRTTVPESHLDILEKSGFAHVATLGPDGAPQTTPVWYHWDGTILSFSHTTNRQKYRNIRRDPRIAISITDPNDPYRYIEIRGIVQSIDDDSDHQFINAMANKYLGKKTHPWQQPEDVRVVVRVHPRHITVR